MTSCQLILSAHAFVGIVLYLVCGQLHPAERKGGQNSINKHSRYMEHFLVDFLVYSKTNNYVKLWLMTVNVISQGGNSLVLYSVLVNKSGITPQHLWYLEMYFWGKYNNWIYLIRQILRLHLNVVCHFKTGDMTFQKMAMT